MRLWFPVSSPLFPSSCWGEDVRYGLGKNPGCGLNLSPLFNMTRRRLAYPAPGLAQHGLLVLAAVCPPRRQVGGRRYENSWSVEDARLGVRALVGGCDDDVTMMKKEERLGAWKWKWNWLTAKAQLRQGSCIAHVCGACSRPWTVQESAVPRVVSIPALALHTSISGLNSLGDVQVGWGWESQVPR